ncbi:unnamed protein product [Brassica rapa subsp. narinosa]
MKPGPKLVAFELIPQLLKQARGDDSTTLLTFPGQVLPQHAGLTVVHLRKAEHEAGLVVQPMMEISGTHDERWAAWDDEKYDKKVENMLGMIKIGYAFSKGDWGGGDGGDPIYKHGVKVNAKKRKGAANIGVTEAPALKQRRVSGYFRRGAMVDAQQYKRMEAHVQELVLEVQKLKNVVERQGRKFEKWKTFVKGKGSIKKQGSIKSRTKRRTLQGREWTVRRCPVAEDEDESAEDDVPVISAGDTEGEGDVKTPEQSSRSISEDRPSLLVRLPPGDGVPLQWVEPGAGDKVVYRAVHSQTFFVHSEEEDSSVGGGSREQGGSGDGLDASAMSALDAIVLAATGVKAGDKQSEVVLVEDNVTEEKVFIRLFLFLFSPQTEKIEKEKGETMSEEKGDLMSVEEGKGEEKIENENDESDSQVEFCAHDPVGDSEDAEIIGVGPNTNVLVVSDTSDGGGLKGMSQLNKKVNWRQCCWQRISTLYRPLSRLLKIATTPTSNECCLPT